MESAAKIQREATTISLQGSTSGELACIQFVCHLKELMDILHHFNEHCCTKTIPPPTCESQLVCNEGRLRLL